MNNIFKELKDALTDFKSNVEKELEDIRKSKEEIKTLRSEIINFLHQGRYIRDENRLILSAPEIIIGNIDPEGDILPDSESVVVIRGGRISHEGTGHGGTIEMRAQSIRQIAVDPGGDGLENVLGDVSEIISQARTISLQANDDREVFSTALRTAGEGGILIQADNNVLVESSPGGDNKKKYVEGLISTYEKQKSTLKDETESSRKNFESLIKNLEDQMGNYEKQFDSEEDARANIKDIMEINSDLKELSPYLITAFKEYSKNLAQLAELSRKINSLKKQKDKIKTGQDFKDKPNGATIDIKSEKINIISTDSENNLKDTIGSGILLQANAIDLASIEEEGTLKKDGAVNMTAMQINMLAVDEKNVKTDEKGQMNAGDFEAKGKVSIKSKEFTFESIDFEISDSKFQSKNLTKDGGFKVRAENVVFDTTDPEGKATGDISLNSKNISIKSMDVEKEKRTDKSLTEGSTMLLISDKMFIGGKDKETESKLVQTSSETIGSFAKNTFEVQQGEKKSVLQMDGGKMSVSGDATEIYGKTTINDATEIKGELKSPKAIIDNVEAKISFKSPNISDGMSVGGGGGGSNLSVKLQKEEAPKKETK